MNEIHAYGGECIIFLLYFIFIFCLFYWCCNLTVFVVVFSFIFNEYLETKNEHENNGKLWYFETKYLSRVTKMQEKKSRKCMKIKTQKLLKFMKNQQCQYLLRSILFLFCFCCQYVERKFCFHHFNFICKAFVLFCFFLWYEKHN